MKTRSVKSSQVSGLGLERGPREGTGSISRYSQRPRSGIAQLQVGGSGARPAIEKQSHRPGAGIGAIELIGGKGDIGLRLAPGRGTGGRTRRGGGGGRG